MPRPAPPPRAMRPPSPRPASSPAIASPLCAATGRRFCLRSWAAAGSAPSLFPSIPLRAAHSSSTFSAIAARDFWSSSAGCECRAVAGSSRFPLEAVWLVGEGECRNCRRLPLRAVPAAAKRAAPYPVEPGDTFAILYTSGTTGLSKGVCCPHAQYFWWGVYTRRTPRRARRRRADDDVARVPHQRA